MKLLSLFLISLLLLSCPLAALPASAEVDTIFKDWSGQQPGGAVGVVLQDRSLFSKGYGMANLARKVPNSPGTVFDLASVSKQFTATTVLVQAQKGKLDLEEGLGTYLPGLPEYAASTPLSSLLNMTSGLPDYGYEQEVKRADLIAQLQSQEPSFDPGEQYEYLNMNYALLTFVVQKVASQSLGQVLENSIFKPLKMTNTTFLSKPNQAIANRAEGYVRRAKGWARSVSDVPGVGDGNVFSSVADLSLWVRDLLKGSSVLSAQLQKRAWTSGKTSDGEETGYGYGFEIGEHSGYKRISHDGAWYGSSTYIGLYPGLKLGVIVLSNREDEDTAALGEQVEDLYLP